MPGQGSPTIADGSMPPQICRDDAGEWRDAPPYRSLNVLAPLTVTYSPGVSVAFSFSPLASV